MRHSSPFDGRVAAAAAAVARRDALFNYNHVEHWTMNVYPHSIIIMYVCRNVWLWDATLVGRSLFGVNWIHLFGQQSWNTNITLWPLSGRKLCNCSFLWFSPTTIGYGHWKWCVCLNLKYICCCCCDTVREYLFPNKDFIISRLRDEVSPIWCDNFEHFFLCLSKVIISSLLTHASVGYATVCLSVSSTFCAKHH